MMSLMKLLPAAILAWLPAGAALAVGNTDNSVNPSDVDIITGLTGRIGNVISGIQGVINLVGVPIIVLMIIIGGIQYITGQKEAGKKTIIAAVIGTAIIVLAWIIVNAVSARLEPFNTFNTP